MRLRHFARSSGAQPAVQRVAPVRLLPSEHRGSAVTRSTRARTYACLLTRNKTAYEAAARAAFAAPAFRVWRVSADQVRAAPRPLRPRRSRPRRAEHPALPPAARHRRRRDVPDRDALLGDAVLRLRSHVRLRARRRPLAPTSVGTRHRSWPATASMIRAALTANQSLTVAGRARPFVAGDFDPLVSLVRAARGRAIAASAKARTRITPSRTHRLGLSGRTRLSTLRVSAARSVRLLPQDARTVSCARPQSCPRSSATATPLLAG
jgi:hypothetical protein